MSIEDKMTIDERRKYLRKMQERYLQADRKERGQLLDEMEIVTGLHRKSLIRLMKGNLVRQPRRRQRSRTYGPEVDDALRVIAESTDYICAERLTPNLVWLAEHLAAHGELTVSLQLLEQLDRISVSTVERILARLRQDEPRLPRRGPKHTNNLLRDVPMKRIPWQELHPDNGSEFFNHHMLRFWHGLKPKPQLSRSRPYHKNDNRFVEQKNSTLVRAFLGYDRLDTVAQTAAVNQLYDKMWAYYNLFQPVMRLREKTSIREEGQPSRIRRRFDKAATPFDRLCATKAISPEQKDRLDALRDQTNPRQLRQEI